MRELSIDIETYSETDIEEGVHKYVEDECFEILLVAYSFDDDPVRIIDLAMGEELPGEFQKWLCDPSIKKSAYNAAFERVCFQKYFGVAFDPAQWFCTMIRAAQAGYPFGLGAVAGSMQLQEQKDTQGKALIKLFCEPCKPTKKNDGRLRNRPEHFLNEWLDFKAYCIQDVKTEKAIKKNLEWFQISDFEKPMYALDQKINDRGVRADRVLVNSVIDINNYFTDLTVQELKKLTGIDNPKSPAQIKNYIKAQTGEEVVSLNKESIEAVVANFAHNKQISKVLTLRERLSRTSIKKFYSINNSILENGRVCGLFQYYGASRTGRWSGRRVQLQNLKRNSLKDLDFARELMRKNEKDAIQLIYEDVGLILSNLIRTAFVPDPGKSLIVSDFSAIEARITAWFADEKWRMDIFKTHGKIYEASASQMFNMPLEEITKDLRQKGKVAELSLGYQGAVGALQRMGGEAMGLSITEMEMIVKLWRKSNKKIVQLWYDVQECATRAIKGERCKLPHGLLFWKQGKNLMIKLPSGRDLVYKNAGLVPGKWGQEAIIYEGLDQDTGKWSLQDTYGGKLVENIVQATARDVLADTMLRLDRAGFDIIMHVHDEVVLEAETRNAERLAGIVTNMMREDIPWAAGLPLGAETFIASYYQK